MGSGSAVGVAFQIAILVLLGGSLITAGIGLYPTVRRWFEWRRVRQAQEQRQEAERLN